VQTAPSAKLRDKDRPTARDAEAIDHRNSGTRQGRARDRAAYNEIVQSNDSKEEANATQSGLQHRGLQA
jgi:hypothetical protein